MGKDLESELIQPLSVSDWDNRFRIQSRWSYQIRKSCRNNFPISPFSKILEVGCGTGAVLSEYPAIPGGLICGIDLDLERLKYFRKQDPKVSLITGNGCLLPFSDEVFDQCFCHYFLLWLIDPLESIREIKRLLKKGGHFFIFSEPDYGGRIDYPLEFEMIKNIQIEGLIRQGADPFMGRKIIGLLKAAGFASIHTGILSWSSDKAESADEIESEWKIIEADNLGQLSNEAISELKNLDLHSRIENRRVQYVPVFFGWGTA